KPNRFLGFTAGGKILSTIFFSLEERASSKFTVFDPKCAEICSEKLFSLPKHTETFKKPEDFSCSRAATSPYSSVMVFSAISRFSLECRSVLGFSDREFSTNTLCLRAHTLSKLCWILSSEAFANISPIPSYTCSLKHSTSIPTSKAACSNFPFWGYFLETARMFSASEIITPSKPICFLRRLVMIFDEVVDGFW